jgi:hypothetical protein
MKQATLTHCRHPCCTFRRPRGQTRQPVDPNAHARSRVGQPPRGLHYSGQEVQVFVFDGKTGDKVGEFENAHSGTVCVSAGYCP